MVSLEHNIVWLALCSAKMRQLDLPAKEELLETFVNKKLLYLVNSLVYAEVYELLVFVLSLPHIKLEVY